MAMERVMKILPDAVALVAGGLLAMVICEVLQRLVKFKRFATAWMLMFVSFGLLMPSILRVLIFPYTGAMSGMNYIATAVATFVAMIFYVGTFCWATLVDTPEQRRLIYCLIAFYIVGITFLFYMASDANGPIIG
ncbi:hypothetical protein NQ071_22860 [Escherichia coli]|uniref:hypothetical protein n=1 Tax=Escherichia coli TaxID=562 RepID=UPI0023F81AF9|nr:hypothetical protein [Escherichia coli]MDF7563536.1 hypothetical protein [Escherichia coli]MDF7605670.1 hypothetical protein [Escherichia coli]MDF7620968.1 hypothetical protein [Escherichia coli]